MRSILIAAIALMVIVAVPAGAQQQSQIYPTGPCKGVPGMKCAQVNLPNPYAHRRPNVLMPGTNQMVNGHRRNIVARYPNGTIVGAIGTGMAVGMVVGGHRRHATGYNGGMLPIEQPIGVRGALPPQGGGAYGSNAKKQEFLAGCAAYGAPVEQMGGGRLHCHVDAHIETIID